MIESRRSWRHVVVPELRIAGAAPLFLFAALECLAVSALIWGPQVREFTSSDYLAWWAIAVALPVFGGATLAYRPWKARVRVRKSPADRDVWATVRAATVRVADGKTDPRSIVNYRGGRLVLSDSALELWSDDDPLAPAVSVARSDIRGVELVQPVPGLGAAPIVAVQINGDLRLEVVLAFGTFWDLFGSRVKDIRAVALKIPPRSATVQH